LPPCLWRGLRLLRGFLRSLRASCNLASGFFPLSGLCGLHSSPGELLQCSDVSLLGLGGSSGGGSAVLLGSRGGGGRSISVLERINPSCSGGEESLPLQVVLRWWSKYDCLQCNTGCLERRSSQAVLRGSRLRLEAGSTILIVSWSTRRAFSCPHRALKAP